VLAELTKLSLLIVLWGYLMEDDLQRFRDAWIAQVSDHAPSEQPEQSEQSEQPEQPEQSEAVSAYIAASNHERCGNFHAAMTEYRRAERLYPEIHSIVSSNLNILPLDVKPKKDTLSAPVGIMPQSSHVDHDVVFIPSNPGKNVCIGILPDELIIGVVKWNLYWDLSYYSKLSLTCKKMCALVKDQRIWRFCCERIHPKELLFPKSTWFNHWLTIPRIRVDGVYISRVTYTRQGLDESSLYNPVHLVTY
jgi:hypothetical protein